MFNLGNVESVGVPLSCFYDRRTRVTQCTNAVLIKDMDNPLYKNKPARPGLPVPITIDPPRAALSLEGFSIAPPTDEATE